MVCCVVVEVVVGKNLARIEAKQSDSRHPDLRALTLDTKCANATLNKSHTTGVNMLWTSGQG